MGKSRVLLSPLLKVREISSSMSVTPGALSALRDVGMNQTSVASYPRNVFWKILRFIPLIDTAQHYVLTE